jgi:6-phosphogluconolactonase
LVLLNIHGDSSQVINPAFSRYHPNLNVVYTCTEDIEQNGKIFAYQIGPNGELTQFGEPVDAGGTSTCYLTIDKSAQHMLCVNYWDSTLGVIPMDVSSGALTGPIKNMYDPKRGQKVLAAGRCAGGVNHSNNDDATIRMRQKDPHSHALVLDPYVGCVAYVPDLGKDLVREFYYDRTLGSIAIELNVLPSGLCTGLPDGPRYFEFHPKFNIAYVVNELSSTVAVFEVDQSLLHEMEKAAASGLSHDELKQMFQGRSTLRLVQSIKTIPSAFPTTMNTCGRLCVHDSGKFVVVSNRGHQSIAIFRVSTHSGPRKGELTAVGYFHTRGETPRHFQFDASGQYLLVANQDSDSLAVFNFNLSTGMITYTGNEYKIPSPNFICRCPVYQNRPMPSTIPESQFPVGNIVNLVDTNSETKYIEQTVIPKHIMDRNDSGGTSMSTTSSECSVEQQKHDQLSDDGDTMHMEQLAAELKAARLEIETLRMQLTMNNGIVKQVEQPHEVE